MRALAACLALLLSLTASARTDERSFLIVVSGIGGEPAYSETFAKWSKSMITAAEVRMGMPREHIVYLAETQTDGANAISHKSAVNAAIDHRW